MEVTNACFVVMKDGKKFNKWEIATIQRYARRGGCRHTTYYFDTKEQAELYRKYLISRECVSEARRHLSNKYCYNNEREEWNAFIDEAGLAEMEKKVSKINPTITTKAIKCMI